MILNTTKPDSNTVNQINKAVGKPYNIFQKWRMRILGKTRFSILEMSPGFEAYAVGLEGEDSCQIELRPNGILIQFKRLYEDYTWAIPYYHLSIYKNGKTVSVYRNTNFIRFIAEVTDTKSKTLIHTIIRNKGLFAVKNDIREVYNYL